jgi:uncharacterized protein YndB with AHSA1/START domain
LTATEQDAVKVSRIFDYPRETVFKMWTDPTKLAEWWGPEGSVTINSEVDPRPGGEMRVDQRNADGIIYSFMAIFEKVIPSERLVFRHASPGTAGFAPWEALHTVTFEELGPKRTRVTAVTTTIAGPREERESLKEAYTAGWGQSLDKLQRALR